MDQHYDVIVVGGRCAGAATAMHVARAGLRVLVVEATRPGTDTLSTHALMRGAVLQLHRWGLLEQVVAAGTPAITATDFSYGEDSQTVEIRPDGGVEALYAPRRTLLDSLLLDEARRAGAEVRSPARVTHVLTEGSRVRGVEGVDRGTGVRFRALAPLTIGADGRGSTVARAVDAPLRRTGTHAGAIVYGYFPGLPADRYHWIYRPGRTAGVVPTNDGLACVWAGAPSDRFTGRRGSDLEAAYLEMLTEAHPGVARSIAGTPRVGPLRAFPGQPGWIRASAGAGWALVGDAGYFKDPITAHGITDALRDAQLLARAVISAPRSLEALRDYERTRDRLSAPLFDLTDRIAGYRWDLPELREMLRELSEAMRPEVAVLKSIDQTPAA